MNSRGRSAGFASNVAWSFALLAINVVTGFIVPRAIIGSYGSEVNGIVNSLSQLISYVNLVEGGISAAAVFALYKPLAEEDVEQANIVISASRLFYLRSGLAFVVLSVALAVIYPSLVDIGSMEEGSLFILVIALGASGFMDFFTLAKYRVLLTASQRNWVIQIATIIYSILRTIIIALFAGVVPVWVLYTLAVSPVIIRTILLIIYSRREYPWVDYKANVESFRLEQSGYAFYLQVLSVVQSGFPLLAATFVVGDLRMVSVLSVYMLVASAIERLASAFGNGTQASFGDVIARGERDVLERSYGELMTLVYTSVAAMCGVAIVLINPFVGLYTGDVAEFSYEVPAIGMLAITNVLLYHLKTPQGLLVISAGKYKDTWLQTTTQTVLLVTGSILGALAKGVPGVLIGPIVSNLYRDIDLMAYIPKKVTKTPIGDTCKMMLLALAQFLFTASPLAILMPTIRSWGMWSKCLILGVIWAILVAAIFCICFERENFSRICGRLLRLLRH